MSIDITPRAQADIDDASEDIGWSLSETVARLFQRRLDELLRRLERLPLLAAAVDPPCPKYPGLRLAPVKRFEARLVCYVPVSGGIRVLRVIHSARDLDAVFG